MDVKTIKRESAYAIRELAEICTLREDSPDYHFEKLFKCAKKCIKNAEDAMFCNELGVNQLISEKISEFGCGFHTFLRKGCDCIESSNLWRAIDNNSTAWTKLLHCIEQKKEKPIKFLGRVGLEKFRWDMGNDLEILCALKLFFIENSAEEIEKSFKEFCGDE